MSRLCENIFEWIEKPLQTVYFVRNLNWKLNEHWSELLSDVLGREVKVEWYFDNNGDIEMFIEPTDLTDDEIEKIKSMGFADYPDISAPKVQFHLMPKKDSKPCEWAKDKWEYY